jgi:alkane 1-monooxygenase
MKKWKYLAAYNVPVFVLLSLMLPGAWSFLGLIYAFGFVPLLEVLLPVSDRNMTEAEEEAARKDWVYDLMVYSNVPIQLGLLLFYLYGMGFGQLSALEMIGKTLSMGVACGALGINVAHELGHRSTAAERIMSKILLSTSLYMHFIIEHNLGHHKHVSTDEDPASAPKGMHLYAFIPRSVWGGYRSAWHLEAQRLKARGKGFWSLHNEMIRFSFIQGLSLVLVFALFGPLALLGFIAASAVGIGLLETVNYIEHYGLRRERKASGRYERVMPHHSWNSSHPYGRLMLYELTRHSDHHYLASRPYQVLRHFEEAPQMPFGYPAMVLLATVPPLWFAIMNPRVDRVMGESPAQLA